MSRFIRLKDTLIDKDDILMICYNDEYKEYDDYEIMVVLQNKEDLEFDFVREDWLKEAIDELERDFDLSSDCNIIQITTGVFINLDKISTFEKKGRYDKDDNFIVSIDVTWKEKMIIPRHFIIQGNMATAEKILNLIQERG